MSWPLIELGSVANFINGFAFKPAHWETEGKPIIRIQNLTNSNKPFNYSTMEVAEKYHVTKGDLLVSWSATLDVFEWAKEDALLNQHIFKVEPDFEKIDKDYLRFALRDAIESMMKFTRGSTMKHVNRGDFLGTQIPLPPLSVQKQIAAVLEKADTLRAQCQQMEQEFNSLAQSVFFDMFGDPVNNPKGWIKKPLGEVSSKITDGTHKTPNYTESGIKFLSAKNISSGRINWEDTKFISVEEHELLIKRCNPELGDILLAKSGTIGIAAIVDREIEFSLFESAALIKYDRQVLLGEFLLYLMNSENIRQLYKKSTKGNSIKHLHLVDIRKLEVPIPPVALQEEFTSRIALLEKKVSTVQNQKYDFESLFNSLMQRAFKGELNLKDVALRH